MEEQFKIYKSYRIVLIHSYTINILFATGLVNATEQNHLESIQLLTWFQLILRNLASFYVFVWSF